LSILETSRLPSEWSCDEWISWDPAKNSCESMLKERHQSPEVCVVVVVAQL